MKIIARGLALLAAGLALPLAMSGQDAAPAHGSGVVSFAFERPGVAVPKFTLRIAEDGSGRYQGEESAPVSPYPGVSTPPTPIDREFRMTAATTTRIFALAREAHDFNLACASKIRNIADTGKKTISYKGPDGEGSCTFNYSENKSVAQLADMFFAIAATMDEGRYLDHLHRYDRLGLDAALDVLAQEVAAGRAVELGSIEATLRSIATDTEVMQRARARANVLLTQAGTGAAGSR